MRADETPAVMCILAGRLVVITHDRTEIGTPDLNLNIINGRF